MHRRHVLRSLAAGAVGAGTAVPTRSMAFDRRAFDGFWMPEEADPHARTFMQWPVNLAVYRNRSDLAATQRVIAKIANTIVAFEPVVMLVAPGHRAGAQRRLSQAVEIWPVPTDDLWARDSGPIFIRNAAGEGAIVDLNFNGWGNRMPHGRDARVAARVARHMGLPLLDAGVVGEGGGVETDGQGTLLAHESSWVNPNRSQLPRRTIERRLLRALGAETMIWAPGVAGRDVTDGHIDGLARFVAPGVVLIQLPERIRPNDPWSRSAFETYEILAASTDARGRRLELVTVPEPAKASSSTYPNYYVFNGGVLASKLGDPRTDEETASILGRLYPDREVMMMDTEILGALGGGIHCATQQQPAF